MILDASRGMRPLLMMLGLLHATDAKTMYRSAIQINRERNASWYYGPLGLDGVEATIAFIGDSTHRNQLQFLCDVLGTQPRDIATGTSSTGLMCSSKGSRRRSRSLMETRTPGRCGPCGPYCGI